MSEQHDNPPQGGSALRHSHQFQIVARDTVITRWCTTCGKTWIIIRYAQSGEFTHKWREISES